MENVSYFPFPELGGRQCAELDCYPLAPVPACALTCGQRVPVLLKTDANKTTHQTRALGGGRCAPAKGPAAEKEETMAKLSFSIIW